jgi:hypothetical protein
LSSVEAFWQALGGKESGYSYSAARNWHAGRRKAPAGYLARVAETFNVSLPWLVSGTPPMSVEKLNEDVSTITKGVISATHARFHMWVGFNGAHRALEMFFVTLYEVYGTKPFRGELTPESVHETTVRLFPSLTAEPPDFTGETESNERRAAQFFAELSAAYLRFFR